ncbi:MAG: ureidoglycolate lyase [Rhodospirillales bacterium]|nr:ureidoglycolate lyase [Rhodospirillales bacterium]
MTERTVTAVSLTKGAFRPFGDVIEPAGDADMMINDGRCERFHDLARLTFDGGDAGISLFRTDAISLPYKMDLMERHPLGSQAFIPMVDKPFLVVVAPDDAGRPGAPHAFMTGPGQGVNYLNNVWHAPLLALEDGAVFAVVDRIGGGGNLEEFRLATPVTVLADI